jgi:hypothetical protein|nr:hypothetical protein [Neorhizobium tomejilense]
MALRVIQGGKSVRPDSTHEEPALPRPAAPVLSLAEAPHREPDVTCASAAGVWAEASRRRVASGVETARTREAITGQPMPRELRNLALRMDVVAAKLVALRPIPEDFASDIYWPS